MLKSDFDKYLKDNLESARYSWDKEEMWADIESELPKASKRRRIFIWFFLGVALATFTYLMIDSRSDNFDQSEYSTLDKVNENGSRIKYDQSSKELIVAKVDKNQEESISDRSLEETVQSFVKKKGSDKNDGSKQQGLSVDKFTKVDKIAKTEQFAEPINVLMGIKDDQDDFEAMIMIPEVKKGYAAEANAVHLDIPSTGLLSMDPYQDILNTIPKLVSKDMILNARERQLPNIKDSRITPLNMIHKTKTAMGHFIGLSMSASVLQSDYSSILNDELLEARRTSETVLESYSLALTYRIYFSNNFFINPSIQYQRINERLEYNEQEISSNVSYIDTAAYYINYMGDLQYVGREISVTTRRNREYLLYNSHNRLLMPVLLGYGSGRGDVKFFCAAGPVLNLYQSYSGALINSDLSIDLEYTGGVKKKDFFSAIDLKAGLVYQLNPLLSLTGNIAYRKSLGSFSLDGLVEQGYDELGINVGLFYKL